MNKSNRLSMLQSISMFVILFCSISSFAQVLFETKPVIYPYYVNPDKYPNSEIRKENHGHLVSMDTWGDRVNARASVKTPEWGTLFRGEVSHLKAKPEILQNYRSYITRRPNSPTFFSLRGIGKIGLAQVGKHSAHTYHGRPPQWIFDGIKDDEVLRKAFLGFTNGESDQEYVRYGSNWIFPQARTRKGRFADWQNFYSNYEISSDYQLVSVTDYHAWHYTSKYGSATMLRNQMQPRDDVGIPVASSMIRGAAKQYGYLIGAKYTSQFRYLNEYGLKSEVCNELLEKSKREIAKLDAKGFKNLSKAEMGAHKKLRFILQATSVDNGVSYSVMRNYYFTEYLRNYVALATESTNLKKCVRGSSQNNDLSGLGHIVKGFQYAQDQIGGFPGQLYVSSAFLLDYFSGWKPAEIDNVFKVKDPFNVWAQCPYNEGDYFTSLLYDYMYPGFINQAWTREMRFINPATPHGETDAVLSDVRQEILDQYGMVVAAGKLVTDPLTLRVKLEKYLEKERTLVITADNARRIFPDWNLDNTNKDAVGNVITFNNGFNEDVVEDKVFELVGVGGLPSSSSVENYEIIARCGEQPAIVKFNYKIDDEELDGQVILLLSPFGMNKEKAPIGSFTLASTSWYKKRVKDPKDYKHIEMDNLMGYPFSLLNHVRVVLDDEYEKRKLFDFGPSKELTSLVTRKSKNKYVVGLFNSTLKEQKYSLKYKFGAIKKVRKIKIIHPDHNDVDVRKMNGFKPKYFDEANVGKSNHIYMNNSGVYSLAGNDMCLYVVEVDQEDGLEILPEINKTRRGKNNYIKVSTFMSLKDTIMGWGAFFEYFDGVKLDARYLLDVDKEKMSTMASWLKNQKVKYLVDARNIEHNDKMMELFDRVELISAHNSTSTIILKKVSKKLRKYAKKKNILIEDGKNSESFQYINKETKPENALKGVVVKNRVPNKVVVFDMVYNSWDDIFSDYELAYGETVEKASEFKGQENSKKNTLYKAHSLNKNYFLTLRKVEGIEESLAKYPDFFKYFGGICIQAGDIRNWSDEKFKETVEWLTLHNLSIVVDYSSDIDYIHYTFDAQNLPETYRNTKTMFKNMFMRMKTVGLTDAVFTSSFQKGGNDRAQIKSIKEIGELAKEFDVNLHYRPVMNRRHGGNLKEALGKIVEPNANIYFAPSFLRKNDSKTSEITNGDINNEYVKYVLLESSGDQTGTVILPIHMMKNVNTKPTSVNFDTRNPDSVLSQENLNVAKKLIFDAEYLNWEEVLLDLKYLNIPSQELSRK